MTSQRPFHLLILGTALLLPVVAAAQVVFTVTATANNSTLGYTAGQAVTFSYTLNNYAPLPNGSNSSASANNFYSWSEERISQDPLLFSAVSGTGLSGTWTQPNAQDVSPSSAIAVYNNSGHIELYASKDDGSNGLIVGGTPLTRLYFDATFAGLNFGTLTGTLPDPTVFFSTIAGPTTYNASSQITAQLLAGSSTVNFTVNSLTISGASVPEPSTFALVSLGAIALVAPVLRRRSN